MAFALPQQLEPFLDDTPATLGVLRMVNLLAISAAGILAIYFGYKLFMAGPNNYATSGGSFKSALFNLTFSKAGPGVFFVLFGALILIFVVTNKLDIDLTNGVAPNELPMIASLEGKIMELPDSSQKQELLMAVSQLRSMYLHIHETASGGPGEEVRARERAHGG
jgi:hypothetical protein